MLTTSMRFDSTVFAGLEDIVRNNVPDGVMKYPLMCIAPLRKHDPMVKARCALPQSA